MAVLALVHVVEGGESPVEGGLVDRAVGEGHPQLIALADIAQVAAALEGDLREVDAVSGEAVGQRIAGPAIILQMDSTTVVPPQYSVEADTAGNLIIRKEARQ